MTLGVRAICPVPGGDERNIHREEKAHRTIDGTADIGDDDEREVKIREGTKTTES